MSLDIILLLVLIVASAFFSGLEIAMFSLGPAHIQSMVDQGVKGAVRIKKLKSNPEHLLVVILIGNNIANIGSASLATALAIDYFGDMGVGLATGMMTLTILIFGEILPKTFSVRWKEKIALFSARILSFFSILVFPAAWLLELMSKGLTRLAGDASSNIEHDTIVTTMSRLGMEEGKIEEHEFRMVENAFRLDRTTAERLMTPRSNVIMVQKGTKLTEAAYRLAKHPFSRFPVFTDDKEGVIGVVHIRDIYEQVIKKKGTALVESLASKPLFVPGVMPASDLLVLFQRERMHLAIVLDEYGDTDGIVTLEDVLEELVGEIEDEADAVTQDIIAIKDNRYLVYASTTIDDLNRALEVDLPLDLHNTLNGLLLAKFQKIPKVTEQTNIEGFTFTIKQADSRRIILVEMRLPDKPAEEE